MEEKPLKLKTTALVDVPVVPCTIPGCFKLVIPCPVCGENNSINTTALNQTKIKSPCKQEVCGHFKRAQIVGKAPKKKVQFAFHVRRVNVQRAERIRYALDVQEHEEKYI